jgi:uncharacterized protein YecE (DUF72 family)
MVLAFLHQIHFLGDKLGPVLIQLPPSLAFEPEIAQKFLLLLRGNYSRDVVWEPRHASWFYDQATELLAEFQIARVAADPARVPLAASPSGFASVAYFRLHGSSRLYYSAYSSDFLDKLAVQVADLAKKASVWCIFDNTASGFAVRNALELSAKLQQTQTLPRPARKIAPAYSKTE